MKKLLSLLLFLPFAASAQTNQWTIVGDSSISNGPAYTPEIAFSSAGELYATFMQASHLGRIMVKKYDTAWQLVGDTADFPSGLYTNIAVNPSGIPHIAFQDGMNGDKATVMSYADTTWVPVGTAGFTPDEVSWIDLVFSPSGVPYVAFTDKANSSKVSVMKFDGTNWVYVGSPGFSTGEAIHNNLAFSSNGNPYVAFTGPGKIFVMTFSGSSWQNVASSGISTGAGGWPDIVINPAGNIFVSYVDSTEFNKATVMKYNGTNWSPLGKTGFTTGSVLTTSIDLDTDGNPNVSFNDSVYGDRATVMKYAGSDWVSVGNQGFSPGAAFMSKIVFDPLGQPFIIFMNDMYENTVMKFDSLYTGINDLSSGQLPVYPNPAMDIVTIDIPSGMSAGIVEIIGLAGNVVERTTVVQGKMSFDVSELPSGIYFVRIKSAQSTYVQKFIKR